MPHPERLAPALLVVLCLGTAAALGACSSPASGDLGAQPGDDNGGSGDDGTGGGGDAGASTTDAGKDGAAANKDGGGGGGTTSTPIGAPQILSYGGPVMKTPKIVPVFYSGDAYATQLTSFAQKLGASTYWGSATSEYGVGKITAGTAITLSGSAPSSISDSQVKSFLASQLDGTHAAWGTPDSNAIYTIYYPTSTTVTLDGYGTSCNAFLGYHNETTVGSKKVVYAVVPRCSEPGITALDGLTMTTSHELVEASTDPYPMTNPAYAIPDNDHLVWALFPLSELGDMCAFHVGANIKPADLGFLVQRSWSNLSALAGHHPCSPQNAGETYFVGVPQLKDTVTIDFGGGQTAPTKGVAVPLNQSKTIDVALYADGAADAWQVQAVDLAQYYYGQQAELGFALDQTTGKAGDHLALTITRKRNGSYGGSAFLVVSTSGAKQTFWVGFASNN